MKQNTPHSIPNELPMVEFADDHAPPPILYPPPPPLPKTTYVDYSKLFHPWDPFWWKHNFNFKTLSQNRRTVIFCLLLLVAKMASTYFSKPQSKPKQQSQPTRAAVDKKNVLKSHKNK